MQVSRQNVYNEVVTSKEVLDILGINRSRLSQLVKKGKLLPVKKSIYLLQDVMARKNEQEDLRAKFYRSQQKKG